jgi:hypothetical protein
MMQLLGVLGSVVPGLILTYGIWLVATPDPDGGRQAIGRFVIGLVASIVVTVTVRYVVNRLRTRTHPASLTRGRSLAPSVQECPLSMLKRGS